MSNSQLQATRLVCYFTVALIFLWLAHELQTVIISFILALMLAAAMTPVAESWEKRKIPRMATILSIYLGVACLYLVLGTVLFPAIREQGKMLIANIPTDIENLTNFYNHMLVFAGDKANLVTLSPADAREFGMKAVGRTLDMTTGIFGLILNSVFILFLAGYFVTQADNLWKEILRWIPGNYHRRTLALIGPLQDRLGGYVRGQILVATAVAIFFIVGLSLLRVNYALTLGAVAGLLNIVPYVGSIAAAAFAILVAFNQNMGLGIAVIVLFAVEQWIESNFMVPMLLGKQVELHPLAVLFAMIIGATLAGIAGAIVAIPIVSIAIYLGEEFYVKKIESQSAAPLELLSIVPLAPEDIGLETADAVNKQNAV